MTLSETQQKFILHWGEMGNKWGINRTVAHIHALLLISKSPLNAEDIAETLSIARSNVSTSLKELLTWEIIKTVRLMTDRREHFESLPNTWDVFRMIAEKRKKREIDPTLNALRECVKELEASSNSEEAFTQQRIQEILEVFELVTTCYEQANALPTPVLVQILKLENRMDQLLSLLVKKKADPH
ncbi:MAG: ArsR family transcriptional regulator [Cyanobacteria bacterium]|nr:ArsR family transcriptional regulator [Cyanobacteriota bacterium]